MISHLRSFPTTARPAGSIFCRYTSSAIRDSLTVIRTDHGRKESVPVVSIPPQDSIKLPRSATITANFTNKLITTFNLDREYLLAAPISGKIFREMCESQGAYAEGLPISERAGFYYETLGLPKTYNQFIQITFLHAWMLSVRMRILKRKTCREFQQQLINGVFNDIDAYMRDKLGFKSDRAINDYKKEFDNQLRGCTFAYDEALVEGDSILASALWRNLFQAREQTSLHQLEQVVHYVRVQLYLLDQLTDDQFTHAQFRFIEPWGRYDTLVRRDPALSEASTAN